MSQIKVMEYFFGKLDAGGAETLIVNLFKEMDHKKFDVDFLVYENREYFYSQEVIDNGGKIIPLSNRESRILPVRLIQRWWRLYQVLKNGDYDVFHCNCDFSFKFIEMFIAKLAGVKKRVCHSHSTSISGVGFRGKIMRLVHHVCVPLIVKYSTDLIACSADAGDWLYGKHPDKKVLILKNGIDTGKFDYSPSRRQEMRTALKVTDSTLVMGLVARFVPEKNQQYLIQILKVATQKGHPVHLVLVGDGAERKNIESMLAANNLNTSVTFVGATFNVSDYLQAMDVFVMPSLFEGLPVSLIEAQSAGLPCLISDVITHDVDVTGNVQWLSLQLGPTLWWDAICKVDHSFIRHSTRKQIIDSGYDLSQSCRIMEDRFEQ